MDAQTAILTRLKTNNQLTIPAPLARALDINVGDFFEILIKKGQLLLKPKKLIDPTQSWFWSKSWQEGEKEVDCALEEGRFKDYSNVEDLVADLEE